MASIDIRDQKKALNIALGIIVLFVVLGVAAYLVLPAITEIVTLHFEPGLGMKTAAIIAFFVTLVVLIVMAIAAGDGLLGELQYMIPAFLSFFLVLWLMIAWVF
jgi:tartrate dehydratase beta subunit/fumarate hydratase class I family protein